MSELISRTPTWVFVVFFTLLALGLMQTKNRSVRIQTVFILPIAMFGFSLFAVYSVFGLALLPITLYLLGLFAFLFVGLKLGFPKALKYSHQDDRLAIPGSKVPLIFMMAIFFTKYFVGYSIARDLPLVHEFGFLVLISLAYGAFSGVFLSRGFVMFKARKASA